MLALIGLLGVTVAQSTVFMANKWAGPQIVAMLQPAGPVYAALLAWVLKLEIMTKTKAMGVVVSVAGAIGGYWEEVDVP